MHLLPRLDDTTICGGIEWRVFNCLIFFFKAKMCQFQPVTILIKKKNLVLKTWVVAGMCDRFTSFSFELNLHNKRQRKRNKKATKNSLSATSFRIVQSLISAATLSLILRKIGSQHRARTGQPARLPFTATIRVF